MSSVSTGSRGKSWGDTKESAFKNEPWDKKVEWFQWPSNEDITLRPVGNVYIMGRHWPTIWKSFEPGGKPKVYPTWCTKFDSITEEANPSRVCPLCDDFDQYTEKLAICNVIIRKYQTGRSKRENPVVPVMWKHQDVDKTFKKAVEKFKADVADPAKGCDFTFEYDPNNKKSKWTIQREGQTPLSDEELEYAVTDFEGLIPDYGDFELMSEHAREMKKSIARSGYYVISLDNDEPGWAGYRCDMGGKPFTSFPDLAAIKAGDRAAAARKASGAAPAASDNDMPAARRRRMDEPTEQPAPKVAAKAKAADIVDLDFEPSQPKVKAPVVQAAPKPAPKAEAPEEPEGAPFDVDEPVTTKKAPSPKPEAAVSPPETSTSSGIIAGPAKNDAWTKKFSIVWTQRDGATVPTCYGQYEGVKKCMTCPQNSDCLDITP